MSEVHAHFPDAQLVWSEILPQVFYFGAHSQKSMEQQRRKINRWVRTCASRVGCHVLKHPQFVWSDFSLYRFDGVHLSVAGNVAFCDNLSASINGIVA